MSDIEFLKTLESVIGERLRKPSETSYSARLAAAGPIKVAQKLGEEGVELALAAASESNERVVSEAADLVYHLLLLLAVRGIPLDAVIGELARRHRPD
jgi:phosphoribosyl-ATP pyrophosphohydrolase